MSCAKKQKKNEINKQTKNVQDFVQNKTTAKRTHNGGLTQSADRASAAALDTTASYNSKQQPRKESGCHRIQQPKRKSLPIEYPTAYTQLAVRAGAAAPDTAASYNSNHKGESERTDTAVCRNSSIQRRVHAISLERTRATVPDTTVSSNPSGSHHTASTQRRTQHLKYTAAHARN